MLFAYRLLKFQVTNHVFVVTQANAHLAFTVEEAQIQQHQPVYQPSEDLVQGDTSVNLAQHSHWAAEEEPTILMKERPLASRALQGISVQRTPLTSAPSPVPRVISAQMGQSMPRSTHALKATITVPYRGLV